MSWEMVKLSNVAEIIAGQSPESKYYNDKGEGIPFFQGKADFRLDYPVVRYWCTQPTKIAKPLDILMSVRAPVGPTNICDIEACIGRGLAAIRASKKLYYKYLYFYLKTIEEKLASQGNGSTFSAITISVIKDLQIPLPPLPIQKRIAEILDAADALKRNDQALLKKYDELAQAIFIDMFGDPDTNIKKWIVKPLSEICTKITDGTHFTPNYVSDGVPFLRVTDITESNQSKKYITQNEHLELIKRCKPEKGDVLYTKNGTIGVAKAIDWDYEFSIFVSLCLLKINKEFVLPNYIETYLNTPIALKQAKKHSKTGTISNLHLIEIKQILVPVPPIKIQQEFLQKIEKIKSSKKKMLGSDILFNSLIQKAFKGELVN